MVESPDRLTRVFRAEILKPVNYTWSEFNEIINKAMYQSAQLANEVIAKQFLLSKTYIEKKGTFCSMVDSCKDSPLSSATKCAICQQARLLYRAQAKKLLRADISMPSFKNNSLYVVTKGVVITKSDNDEFAVQLSILPRRCGGGNANQPKVILYTKGLAARSVGYYQILERIASGEYKLGVCQLRKDKVRGKMYLLMTYSFVSSGSTSPIPTRVMGVDLGVTIPACCAFTDNVKRMLLFGEGDRLLSVRRQIQSRRRSIAKEITKRDCRRGHGVSGKFHPMQSLNQKWINFRRTWNHVLSNRIVEYAVKEQASTIHIEDLSVDGLPKFLGKDWPVAELLQMIIYKGEEAGLKVERVSSYKTSQTCSRCGVIKDNFTFKDRIKNGMPIFVCESCGFQDHADYNAAKNIAKSTLIVK